MLTGESDFDSDEVTAEFRKNMWKRNLFGTLNERSALSPAGAGVMIRVPSGTVAGLAGP